MTEPSRLSSSHELRTLERPEKPGGGWTVYEYRGVKIRENRPTVQLEMPGHPYDGKGVWAQVSHVQGLVDHWLDQQSLPAPYVWPQRRG